MDGRMDRGATPHPSASSPRSQQLSHPPWELPHACRLYLHRPPAGEATGGTAHWGWAAPPPGCGAPRTGLRRGAPPSGSPSPLTGICDRSPAAAAKVTVGTASGTVCSWIPAPRSDPQGTPSVKERGAGEGRPAFRSPSGVLRATEGRATFATRSGLIRRKRGSGAWTGKLVAPSPGLAEESWESLLPLSCPHRRTTEAAAPTPCAKAQGMARGRAPATQSAPWGMASPAEPASAW